MPQIECIILTVDVKHISHRMRSFIERKLVENEICYLVAEVNASRFSFNIIRSMKTEYV